MDSRALRIFQAVAGGGSVSRAAEALNCVQSNVSGQIKRLEAELGTQLFHRRPRGVVLTAAGETLKGYADQVLKLLDEAEQAVKETEGEGGTFRLGSLETTASVRLPPLLVRYHAACPKVSLTVSTGTTAGLIAKVLNYELDGALVSGRVGHPEILQEPLFEEELVLATARGIDREAALAKPKLLVFRRGCTYRGLAEQWFQEEGLLAPELAEFGSLEAIVGCVAAGVGITLLPRAVVGRDPYAAQLSLHPLPRHIAAVTTYFIRRKDVAVSRALDAFVDLARRDPAAA